MKQSSDGKSRIRRGMPGTSVAIRWLRLAGLALSGFVLSCVTTQLPPISSSGAGFQPLDDELSLWSRARDEEQRLLEQAPIYDDPALVEYLEGVVARLTRPPMMAPGHPVRYQVRVIEDPTLNAFSFPHGSIYLHTGLLARMENESQLATVLGHEMTHVDNRHALRTHRSARNREVGFGLAALAAFVLLEEAEDDAIRDGDLDKWFLTGVVGDLVLALGLQLAFEASVNGYGRDLEREADLGGFARLERASYDLRESPKLYERLKDGLATAGAVESFFFGSHPQLEQRVEAARQHLASRPPDAAFPDTAPGDPAAFEKRMQPVLRDDARDNIEIGRFELAERELGRALRRLPHDAEAHLLLGRLRLAQAEETQDATAESRLRQRAVESLRESVRLAPGRADAHLALGTSAYLIGDFATACAELAAYRELVPGAELDQGARSHLLELERDGRCASP